MKIPDVDIREKDSKIKRKKEYRDIYLRTLLLVMILGSAIIILLMVSTYHPQKVTEEVHKQIEQTNKIIDEEIKQHKLIQKEHTANEKQLKKIQDTIIIIENKKGPKGQVGPQGIP